MFRQTLIERSIRHRMGYEWAMQLLHRKIEPCDWPYDDYTNRWFDCGVSDAVRDWKRRINADELWAQAVEDLERTQPL
jgi:hypothetical protein